MSTRHRRKPRKAPSKAAYPRISAGEGVRLNQDAERGNCTDDDVVHRHRGTVGRGVPDEGRPAGRGTGGDREIDRPPHADVRLMFKT
jgi:hypothetical protein